MGTTGRRTFAPMCIGVAFAAFTAGAQGQQAASTWQQIKQRGELWSGARWRWNRKSSLSTSRRRRLAWN